MFAIIKRVAPSIYTPVTTYTLSGIVKDTTNNVDWTALNQVYRPASSLYCSSISTTVAVPSGYLAWLSADSNYVVYRDTSNYWYILPVNELHIDSSSMSVMGMAAYLISATSTTDTSATAFAGTVPTVVTAWSSAAYSSMMGGSTYTIGTPAWTANVPASTDPVYTFKSSTGFDDDGRLLRYRLADPMENGLIFQHLKSSYGEYATPSEHSAQWISNGGSAVTRLVTSKTEIIGSGALPDGTTGLGAYVCRWQGYIYIPIAGAWTYLITHDDSMALRIGDATCGATGAASNYTGTLSLQKGWKPIDLFSQNGNGDYYVTVTLTPPGGSAALLSTYQLKHRISQTTKDFTY